MNTRSVAVGRIISFETAALCVCNAAGAATFSIQPLWIAAFKKTGMLSPSQLGWLGTGELLCIALAGLLVARRERLSNPGLMATNAALLIAIANALAMVKSPLAVMVGKLLSGLGTGALFATITRVAAQREDSQRVLATMQFATMLSISFIYLSSPILLTRYGPAGLFALVSFIALLAVMAARSGLREVGGDHTGVGQSNTPVARAAILGCAALACVGIGVGTINTYVVLTGNSLGFSAATMAKVMASIGPIAMLGPITAHMLSGRTRLLWAVAVVLLLMVGDVSIFAQAATPVALGLSVALLNTGSTFCLPYTIAFVGRLDASGRLASAAPILALMGAAAGPKLGSELIGGGQFQERLAITSACFLSLALLLLLTAGGISRREEIAIDT